MSQEAEDKVIDETGMPGQDHVYAIFAREDDAGRGERVLAERDAELMEKGRMVVAAPGT